MGNTENLKARCCKQDEEKNENTPTIIDSDIGYRNINLDGSGVNNPCRLNNKFM